MDSQARGGGNAILVRRAAITKQYQSRFCSTLTVPPYSRVGKYDSENRGGLTITQPTP
jgi:hypothetical protein